MDMDVNIVASVMYICYVQVEILYKLQLFPEVYTRCNLYKQLVQNAPSTG